MGFLKELFTTAFTRTWRKVGGLALETQIKQCKEDLVKIDTEMKELNSKAIVKDKRIKKLKKDIEELHGDLRGLCDTARKHDRDKREDFMNYKMKLEDLYNELYDVSVDFNELDVKYIKLEDKKDELVKELGNLQNTSEVKTQSVNENAQLQMDLASARNGKKMQACEEIHNTIEQSVKDEKDLETLLAERKVLEEKIRLASIKLADANDKKSTKEKQIEEMKANYKETKDPDTSKKISESIKTLADIKEEIAEHNKGLASLNKEDEKKNSLQRKLEETMANHNKKIKEISEDNLGKDISNLEPIEINDYPLDVILEGTDLDLEKLLSEEDYI